jgi:hypothetical protein
MFWLRVAQWVLTAHLVLIGALALGGVVGLLVWGGFMFVARGLQ